MNLSFTRLRSVALRARLLRFVGKTPAEVFEIIYKSNGFGGTDSQSGSGSNLDNTRVIRRELPAIVQQLGIRTMLDAPCGDFHWMKEVELDLCRYVGADVVAPVVAKNQQNYSNPEREFIAADLSSTELSQFDLIFCRDCLVHLPNSRALAVLENFAKSKSRYLLTTTFPSVQVNKDIITGSWRPVNLQLPPFDLPAPVRLINEECTEQSGRYSDKSLGLWTGEQLRSRFKIKG